MHTRRESPEESPGSGNKADSGADASAGAAEAAATDDDDAPDADAAGLDAAGARLAPSVSIVLPVLNEARDLPRLLDELTGQAAPPGGFEVLVADGGSTDGTQECVLAVARRHPNVKLLSNPLRRSSAGRNVGARAARGQYIMFLDGHCALPRTDYLVRLHELFQSTGAACLCRPQPLNQLRDGGWGEAISNARHSWLGHDAGSDIYGGEPGFTDPKSAGAAYLRDCIEQLGGYDERFDACEDVEFNHRVHDAGFRSYRHPDLAVHYRPRTTLAGLYRQMFRYGRGRARLMARHAGVVPKPLLAITLFTLLLASSPLWLAPAGIALLAGGPLALWLVLALAESVRTAGASHLVGKTLAAFATIFLALTLGFWRGLFEAPRYRRPMQPPPQRVG